MFTSLVGNWGAKKRRKARVSFPKEGERRKKRRGKLGYIHFARLTNCELRAMSCERRRVPAGDGWKTSTWKTSASRTHISPDGRISVRIPTQI